MLGNDRLTAAMRSVRIGTVLAMSLFALGVRRGPVLPAWAVRGRGALFTLVGGL